MDDAIDGRARAFLTELLETPSPAGYEVEGQRVWTEYVSEFADDVWTDEYGNAVAVHEGSEPAVAFAGHADEIGFIVRSIDDDGFLRVGRIGGVDASVSQGQHVTVHAEERPVEGVVGQHAIHVRDRDGGDDTDVSDLWIDVGAGDGDALRDEVAVGDPVTFSSTFTWLGESRLAGRGLDNRVGTWAAAEGLRRAVEADVDATVYAISTVQEELGTRGAKMIGFDVDPDAVIAIDVGHALDYPSAPSEKAGEAEIGGGPVVARGSTNHPVVTDAVRTAADEGDIEIQLEALGTGTGTDADSFFVARGATPAQVVSVPNRYMHTPVELVDVEDLVGVADLLGAFAERAGAYDDFGVDL